MKELEVKIGNIFVKISVAKDKKTKESLTKDTQIEARIEKNTKIKEKAEKDSPVKEKSANSRRKFFISICVLFLTIKGRINFSQMHRYGHYNQTTYHAHFEQKFDFLAFNKELALQGLAQEKILIFDPSWLPKSGKKTPNRDKFWSGCSGQAKYGLEIGSFAVADVKNHTALHLEAIQTPNFKTLRKKDQTLPQYYAQLTIDRKDTLEALSKYLCLDSYFAKIKYVTPVLQQTNLHIISRLRDDAALFYLYKGIQSGKGRPKIKDGKINLNDIDKQRLILEYQDTNKIIYTACVYCRSLKRIIKLAYTQFLNEQGEISCYKLYFSTDTHIDGYTLQKYYQLRYQIEFLYRDAKQHTGLTHCQSTNPDKINFHVNTSLTALSLAKTQHWLSLPQEQRGAFSMANIKNTYHNEYLLDRFLLAFGMDANVVKKDPIYAQLVNIGRIAE